MEAVNQLFGANKVEVKQKMLEALRLLWQADQALYEVHKYFNNLTKDVWTSSSTNPKKECKGELEMSSGELTTKQDGCLSQLLEWSHIWVRKVSWAVEHGVVPMEITFMDTEDEYKKYGILKSLRYKYSNPFRFPISSLGLPNFSSQKSWEGALEKYTADTQTLIRQNTEL